MREANYELDSFILRDSGFFSPESQLRIRQLFSDKTSLDLIDKQHILIQQIRTMINIAPNNYEQLIYDKKDTDIFMPIEQLNC